MVSEFVKSGDLDRGLVSDMSRAQEIRERADYGIGLQLDREDAEHVIQRAEIFLSAVKAILGHQGQAD